MNDGLVVVTGAGGFVGRALCAHFLATGRLFRAIVRHHEPVTALAPQHHAVADLATTPDDELDALLGGAAAVVHLAGCAHVLRETATGAEPMYRSANVVATVRLAHAAIRAGVRRFVFASTVKVNGETSAPGRPFHPDDPPFPRDAYGQSKLEAERELAGLCAGTALAPIILRLPLIYGPGVKGNVLALLDEIARGRRLPLAAIRNRRSLVYVGNLVEAIDAALDAPMPPRGVHFVTDVDTVSVPDLVRAMAVALAVPARMLSVPVPLLKLAGWLSGRRAIIDRLTNSLEVDPSSFFEATGWRARHTLAEGLVATARWWRLRHAL
jgi:nucleoside-diphosphate-sugar epimerase